VDLMKTEFPVHDGPLWDDVRVVACVGNTIGIIPEHLKDSVYKQMFELAGPSGIVIMAYWNAAWFGDAVQNFYHANPQLCGQFKGESIDLSTATLSTPSGYRTHWTSASEARAVMDNLGAEIISLKQWGKGVLVAARQLGICEDKVHFKPPRRNPVPAKDLSVKQKERSPTSKWAEFPVEQWRSAVYVNRAYFGQLCSDTTDFIVNIAEHVKLGGRRVSLVEVGCGTGEFIRETADAFRVAVGVDFNPHFIQFCKTEAAEQGGTWQHYVHGDACALVDLMKTEFPVHDGPLWDDVRVVACVGNTIGIIPEHLKDSVYKQMFELAGPSGIVIMAYWNAAWFGDAVQNFYHANPQLCGQFKGESIDLSTTTLSTPSGYRTHWTSASEARAVMENLGAEIISLKQWGKGVLVAARQLGICEDKVHFEPPQRNPVPAKDLGVKQKERSPTSKWAEFPVEQWRSAVYVNRAYFGQLCSDTTDFIVNIAEHVKLGGKRVSLVEVGCGTGEFIRETADAFRVAVGVDFNPHFIQFCKTEAADQGATRQHYVHGDACALVDLMKTEFPVHDGPLWDDVRVVACVGNTIGIIPEHLKDSVYKQMFELAGPSGIVIMAYWNAAWFGDAVQNFYHANPQLCGEFSGDGIDLSTTTLSTPSGYRTHWTSASEARAVMDNLGAEIISLKQQGKGVLVAARRLM